MPGNTASAAPTARLLSVSVSKPEVVTHNDKAVRTGIFKTPVDGPVMLRTLNLDGDGQGDLKNHGGPYQAAYAYPIEHYAEWEAVLGRNGLPHGQFGENFTTEGLLEEAVYTGDVYRIGEARVHVTTPRVPCYKLGIRMGLPRFPQQFLESRRSGFYLRVVEEGRVQAGDAVLLEERPQDRISIRTLNDLRFSPNPDPDALDFAATLPWIGPVWREHLQKIAAKRDPARERAGG